MSSNVRGYRARYNERRKWRKDVAGAMIIGLSVGLMAGIWIGAAMQAAMPGTIQCY